MFSGTVYIFIAADVYKWDHRNVLTIIIDIRRRRYDRGESWRPITGLYTFSDTLDEKINYAFDYFTRDFYFIRHMGGRRNPHGFCRIVLRGTS